MTAKAKKKAPSGPSPAQQAAVLRRQVAKLERELAAERAKNAKPVDAAAQPSAPPETLAEIVRAAQLSNDPLALQHAAYRALADSFFDAAIDEDLSPRERRKELRTISMSMAKAFPGSRLWEVEQLIKTDNKAIAAKASEKRSGKLEPRRPK